jgi:alpha-glucuronidase
MDFEYLKIYIKLSTCLNINGIYFNKGIDIEEDSESIDYQFQYGIKRLTIFKKYGIKILGGKIKG